MPFRPPIPNAGLLLRHFEKKIQVIDWDGETVPKDWDKDWDNLSFEERIALCDEYGVIYIATQVE